MTCLQLEFYFMKQVLFVEDDDTIAMGVENLLQISGYEVHHFTNAEAELVLGRFLAENNLFKSSAKANSES